jgi:hypothetical protein
LFGGGGALKKKEERERAQNAVKDFHRGSEDPRERIPFLCIYGPFEINQ